MPTVGPRHSQTRPLKARASEHQTTVQMARFAQGRLVRIAMEHEQVEHQQHHDQHAEGQPVPEGWLGGGRGNLRKQRHGNRLSAAELRQRAKFPGDRDGDRTDRALESAS